MDIYTKLDPQRFPNMSLPMAAILGFVLERQFTTPVTVTSGRPSSAAIASSDYSRDD